ncbi:MAG: hypothetical protein NTX48_11670 [Planctomycetales bacterium]|nr:hypothetical protein [Planctomycetales bacterium]
MPTFSLFVVPAGYWATGTPTEPGTLRPLLQEVVALRRRVSKGANQEAERSRYTNCLADLEARPEFCSATRQPATVADITRAAQGTRVAGFLLPAEYFDLMAQAHLERMERQSGLETSESVAAGSELGSSVIPPKELNAHADELDRFASTLVNLPDLQRLAKDRAEIARSIALVGAGIVEIGEELDNQDVPPPPDRPVPKDTPSQIQPENDSQQLTAKGRKKMAERFRISIEHSLPIGGKVNLSDQPHEVGTEVLAEFLFAGGSRTAGNVRVIYADGSEARPFPLCALPKPSVTTTPKIEPVEGVIELKLALMSMRHLELDPFVERAWYRNKEVSVTRPLAESDEFCFQYSVRELAELRDVYKGHQVMIRMFHTGFEPAAVGFYRAVAKELKSRRGWLRVLPHYYRGGSRFETGKVVWE